MSKTDLITWRVTDAGIIAAGESGPRRTAGDPSTMRRIRATFGARLSAVAPDLQRLRVLAALIASESRGKLDPPARYEAGLGDFSFGPCQFLTSTADSMLGKTPRPPRIRAYGLPNQMAAAYAEANPDAKAWRALLTQPAIAIDLATEYLKRIDAQGCGGDPVLLYAGYNAGSPRPAAHPADKFGLVSFVRPDKTTALDSFAAWFGDACCVFGDGTGVA